MGLADPLRSRCLMLLGEGRSEGQRRWAETLIRAPAQEMDTQDSVDRHTDRKASLYKQVMDLGIQTEARPWEGCFENVLTPKDTKTDRQRAPPPPQTPHARSLSERPCPELGCAQRPTFPVAPCRPCLPAVWLPPCRSAPQRSPPLPGQLPSMGVTRSAMGLSPP